MTKRVWILGAGFSRSLGGPLMYELLSPLAEQRIRATFGRTYGDSLEHVFRLFAGGSNRWPDAEQFLETLDGAARGDRVANEIVAVAKLIGTGRSAIPTSGRNDFERLLATARQTIAASVSVFLDGVTAESTRGKERWQPYRKWMRRLRGGDVIVSFNYDRVVELLAEEGEAGAHVVTSPMDEDEYSLAEIDGPRLYKLHGSVDWIRNGDEIRRELWSPDLLRRNDLAIATPGDGKMELAKSTFRYLWRKAEEALSAASEIHLIGFRFPPSDAHPRDRLLGAIAKNDQRDLNVHVVLGPQRADDVHRVLALLGGTIGCSASWDPTSGSPQRALFAHSLFAQDFIPIDRPDRGVVSR
ncbi:MAG TPA: SIR2 family protein [Kofleriaceae bacterium]|jgi:hypothetical protein